MKPPENVKVYEGELATFWFDEFGILCACAKNKLRTLERQKKNYAFIREIANDQKVCLLADSTSSRLLNDGTQEYIEREMGNYFKAMAVISNSLRGKVPVTIFLEQKKHSIPVMIFNEEGEAREWLKQYL